MKKPETTVITSGSVRRHHFAVLERAWAQRRRPVFWLWILGAVLVIMAGLGAWWLEFSGSPAQPPVAIGNGYEKNLRELRAQPLPPEPIDQVYYYSQLGQNNKALQRYQEALDYYLKAQAVVDAHNLSARASFYQEIADMHEKLGHKIEAAIYRKKAEDRLKAEGIQAEPAQENTWE